MQENEIYKKVTDKERGSSLFRDVSLADKAVVDGGMRLGLIEPSPYPRMGDPRPPGEDENAHLKKGIKLEFMLKTILSLLDLQKQEMEKQRAM